MLTKQEIYEKVITHLIEQGEAAIDGSTCKYRAEDGKKCAVGCLLPDEFYNRNMENKSVADLILHAAGFAFKLPPEINEENRPLLEDLQELHDKLLMRLPLKGPSWDPSKVAFTFAAKLIAQKHGLDYRRFEYRV